MKNQFAFTVLVCMFLTNYLPGQVINTVKPNEVLDFANYRSITGYNHPQSMSQYAQVDGSPYLTKDFVAGQLCTNEGTLFINAALRYNIYKDQIDYQLKGEIYYLNNPFDFSFFIIGTDTFVYLAYSEDVGITKKGYFQLMYKGNSASLLRKKNIMYSPPKDPQPYAPSGNAQFLHKSDSYYIMFNGQLPVEIKMNRRRVMEPFFHNTSLLEQFISENRLNFRNEKDLIKLVEFYNQL